MERVRPAHAMRLEIGERLDDLQLLDDRASTRVTISGSVSLCWERTTWMNECHNGFADHGVASQSFVGYAFRASCSWGGASDGRAGR